MEISPLGNTPTLTYCPFLWRHLHKEHKGQLCQNLSVVNERFMERTCNKMDFPLMQLNFQGELRDPSFKKKKKSTSLLLENLCQMRFWETRIKDWVLKLFLVYLQGC